MQKIKITIELSERDFDTLRAAFTRHGRQYIPEPYEGPRKWAVIRHVWEGVGKGVRKVAKERRA